MSAKQIAKIIKNYQALLNLQEWKITHEFIDSFHEDGESTLAATNILPEYLQIHIRFFKGFIKQDLNTINATICHELCHAYAQEMWDVAGDPTIGEKIVRGMIEKLVSRINKFSNEGK